MKSIRGRFLLLLFFYCLISCENFFYKNISDKFNIGEEIVSSSNREKDNNRKITGKEEECKREKKIRYIRASVMRFTAFSL